MRKGCPHMMGPATIHQSNFPILLDGSKILPYFLIRSLCRDPLTTTLRQELPCSYASSAQHTDRPSSSCSWPYQRSYWPLLCPYRRNRSASLDRPVRRCRLRHRRVNRCLSRCFVVRIAQDISAKQNVHQCEPVTRVKQNKGISVAWWHVTNNSNVSRWALWDELARLDRRFFYDLMPAVGEQIHRFWITELRRSAMWLPA